MTSNQINSWYRYQRHPRSENVGGCPESRSARPFRLQRLFAGERAVTLKLIHFVMAVMFSFIIFSTQSVDAASNYITAIAGSSSAGGYSSNNSPAVTTLLNNPNFVWVDSVGEVYISDTSNQRIRKITTSTGILTDIVGTGSAGDGIPNLPGTSFQIDTPAGLMANNGGACNYRRTVDFGYRVMSKCLSNLLSICMLTGALYFADSGNHRIRYADSSVDHTVNTFAGE
jgi:hypothetical protein